jgi:DNA primase
MPRSSFVDFKAVKAAITMEQVLEHYGLMDKFTKKGDSLNGPCPIHSGSNPTQFRISISKNIWNCFSKCKQGGNVLDFISKMEDVSIHAAALKAIEWFQLDMEAVSRNSDQAEENESAEPRSKIAPAPKKPESKQTPTEDTSALNKPLKFRLEKLERNHPYLTDRRLTTETLVDFGAGFCGKGMMAGRIAIPIHNPNGEVVAYAGRLVGEPTDDNPKYKLPPGFRKSLELFNIDRASKESPEQPLVVVEGFFDCMKFHQHGHRKTVALMGSTMSIAQEELIRKHTNSNSQVIVMLDEDEAGQAGREAIAVRLSQFCFVKTHVFDKAGMQPETLSAEEVRQIVGGAE